MTNSVEIKRSKRIRNKLKKVNTDRFRISIFRSSKNIYAQIIDDMNGKTLASASTLEKNNRTVQFVTRLKEARSRIL